MEASLLGLIFEAVWQGIVGDRANAAFLQASSMGIKALRRGGHEKIVNHDLEADQVYEDDFEHFNNCYKVIWHCAQNLPYPIFYQAWHSATIYPEIQEITGVGTTLNVQRLNLAELPQVLHATIDSDSELRGKVQLICIDGSKFIDRDNPAAYIYTRMVRSSCSRCEDGTPKTMPELQAYWDLLAIESDKRVVLVFYKNPIEVPPQGFSESFMDALSKFDGAIAVVTDTPVDNLPLQQFSERDSQLVENNIKWIQGMMLES